MWVVGVPAQVLRLAWHTALSLLSHGSRPGSEIFTKQNAMWLFLVYQSNDCYNPYGLIVYVHSSVMKMAPPPVSALPVLCMERRMGSCCGQIYLCPRKTIKKSGVEKQRKWPHSFFLFWLQDRDHKQWAVSPTWWSNCRGRLLELKNETRTWRLPFHQASEKSCLHLLFLTFFLQIFLLEFCLMYSDLNSRLSLLFYNR